ncbi:MAG: UDP-4-amino-4,6-dideoxy-N-acetyl-beta-L-altrosamine transaminase [Candidatus Thorarchaeota archaeon]|jgi:UDP-4-amino-4,6-dideoxy-N-acetyl-beta-L-altrosamine transaminase
MKIPYGKQWISNEDIEKVVEVLKSDFLTTGPVLHQFEQEFAKFVGSKFAVAVANGTAALHLAAKAAGVQNGSEIISSPMSFAATSNCVLYNAGRPVFADITDRGLIDPAEVEKQITEKTKGVIPVHYMGLPCELDAIHKIAQDHGLFIIEDACHAIGAKYKLNSIGNCKYSDMAVFSFHPVKHITTGEGGIITTNSIELDSLLRTLRTHGITKDSSRFLTNHDEPWYQEMHHLGFNYRLTEIQAALGLSQLSRINQFVQRRREIAELYSDSLECMSEYVETIPVGDQEFHSYHLYVIKVRDPKRRRFVFESLSKRGVLCQVHYIPIYWHPYYRELGYGEERHPQTESFYERILSIPMYPAMSNDDVGYVLESIKKVFQ